MNRIDHPAACPDFLEVFSDFVDGTLPPDREGEIRAHLDCCEGCLRHLATYRRGVMALKASERDVDPVGFWGALERRLWTEGHLAGGRAESAGADWKHPALAVALAACFAAIVLLAGMWGDHLLHDARTDGGDRPVVVSASAAPGGPVVVESEPIEMPVAPPAARSGETRRRAATPDRIDDVPVVLAGVPSGTDAVRGLDGRDSIDREAEAAYVASLQRELAAWNAIERVRERGPREALRRAWSESRVTADGWVEPVRLGAAGVRTLQARVPLTPWPVEAAVSLP